MFLVPPQPPAKIEVPKRVVDWTSIMICPHCEGVSTVASAFDPLRKCNYFYARCHKDGQIGPRADSPEEALERVKRQRVFRTWIPDSMEGKLVSVGGPDAHAAAVLRLRQDIGFAPEKHLNEIFRITVQELGHPSFTYCVKIAERPTLVVVDCPA